MLDANLDGVNLLTVDLEEWFVVEALKGRADLRVWDDQASTLNVNVRRLLQIFRDHDVRATWFVLGWCAERFPALITQIAADGHEIACHSYSHRRIDTMTPKEFRADTSRAIKVINQACGIQPRGYRAPSWSINDKIPWAFEVLVDLGFEYDSSIFPIKHDLYGMPGGPRTTFRMKLPGDRYLYEVPASTFQLFGKNFPIAGGGYLRHMPFWYTRAIIRKMNRVGQPVVVYLHPWEIDPDPPRLKGLSLLQRLRSYGSTSIMGMKLERILDEFSFTTISYYLERRRRQRIGFD